MPRAANWPARRVTSSRPTWLNQAVQASFAAYSTRFPEVAGYVRESLPCFARFHQDSPPTRRPIQSELEECALRVVAAFAAFDARCAARSFLRVDRKVTLRFHPRPTRPG